MKTLLSETKEKVRDMTAFERQQLREYLKLFYSQDNKERMGILK